VEELDGRGCCAIAGLVDCHTHACFAGDRAQEFWAGRLWVTILVALAASHANRVVFLVDGRVEDEMADPTTDRILDRIKSLGGE